jgi:hypothetical protein
MESTFSEKLKLMFEIITPYVEDESAVKDLKMKMHDGGWTMAPHIQQYFIQSEKRHG